MRNRLLGLAALAALLLLAAPAPSPAPPTRGGLPCDPSPTQVRICRLHGGTFNYATCQCDFP
jgi:hypothetical protein